MTADLVEDNIWWPLSDCPPDGWEFTGRTSEFINQATGKTFVNYEIRPVFDIEELTE